MPIQIITIDGVSKELDLPDDVTPEEMDMIVNAEFGGSDSAVPADTNFENQDEVRRQELHELNVQKQQLDIQKKSNDLNLSSQEGQGNQPLPLSPQLAQQQPEFIEGQVPQQEQSPPPPQQGQFDANQFAQDNPVQGFGTPEELAAQSDINANLQAGLDVKDKTILEEFTSNEADSRERFVKGWKEILTTHPAITIKNTKQGAKELALSLVAKGMSNIGIPVGAKDPEIRAFRDELADKFTETASQIISDPIRSAARNPYQVAEMFMGPGDLLAASKHITKLGTLGKITKKIVETGDVSRMTVGASKRLFQKGMEKSGLDFVIEGAGEALENAALRKVTKKVRNEFDKMSPNATMGNWTIDTVGPGNPPELVGRLRQYKSEMIRKADDALKGVDGGKNIITRRELEEIIIKQKEHVKLTGLSQDDVAPGLRKFQEMLERNNAFDSKQIDSLRKRKEVLESKINKNQASLGTQSTIPFSDEIEKIDIAIADQLARKGEAGLSATEQHMVQRTFTDLMNIYKQNDFGTPRDTATDLAMDAIRDRMKKHLEDTASKNNVDDFKDINREIQKSSLAILGLTAADAPVGISGVDAILFGVDIPTAVAKKTLENTKVLSHVGNFLKKLTPAGRKAIMDAKKFGVITPQAKVEYGRLIRHLKSVGVTAKTISQSEIIINQLEKDLIDKRSKEKGGYKINQTP